jgi:hypothetical protein
MFHPFLIPSVIGLRITNEFQCWSVTYDYYNDELQIKFTFCSGPMIFGRVMSLRLWNLAYYLVVITFFAMLGDIDLIFVIWVLGI